MSSDNGAAITKAARKAADLGVRAGAGLVDLAKDAVAEQLRKMRQDHETLLKLRDLAQQRRSGQIASKAFESRALELLAPPEPTRTPESPL